MLESGHGEWDAGRGEGINGDNIFIIEKLAWLQLKSQKVKFTSGKCIDQQRGA